MFVEEMKTHILCSVNVCLKSCRFWDNVGKYVWDRQAAGDNMAQSHRPDENVTRRMRIAYRIPKATDTHPEYVILITFPCINCYGKERALMGCL
jgi:hypothetical protein